MRKILFLVLLLGLQGCKAEVNNIPPTDLQLEGLRGKVKKLTEVTRMPNTAVVTQQVSTYGEDGYKTSLESLDNELDTEVLEFSTNGIVKYEPYINLMRKVASYDYEGKQLSEGKQKWSTLNEYTQTTTYITTPDIITTLKGKSNKEGLLLSIQIISKLTADNQEQLNVLSTMTYEGNGYQNGLVQKDVILKTEQKYEVANKAFDSFGNVTQQVIYTNEGVLFQEKIISYEYY